MKIGVMGAISLRLLAWPMPSPDDLPESASAPSVAMLANALLARGHQVHVFTLSPDLENPVHWQSGALTLSVGPQRERHRGRDAFAAERRILSAMVASSECEVLHAQWSYEYALAALASGRPTLVTVRDDAAAIARFSPTLHRAAKLVMDAVTKRRAPRLTVTSPHLMRTLPAAVRRKTIIIPNFVSSEVLARSERRGSLTAGVTPVVVSVCNGFSRWKNVAAALAAARVLRRVRPDSRLRLIGADMQPDGPAHAFARRRGLDAGVEFIGPLPHAQLLDQLAGADVLLHPALEEAFGMAVLEAMAALTPVVGGSRSGNVPFLLRDGCGVLCDASREVEMAACVGALLAEPAMVRCITERARRRVNATYTEDVVAPQYVTAYRDLLDAGCGNH